MSENSLKAISKVLAVEGGYVNHPNDRGGPTNYGITQKVYDAYIGRPSTIEEIKNMPIGNAEAIYKKNYWDAIGGDYIASYPVAYIIFDQGVNRGTSSALRQACRVVGIPETGGVNSQLISKINAYDPTKFIEQYLIESEDFYNALVARDPSQEVFINGWMNRVSKIRTYAEANLGQAAAVLKNALNENPYLYALPALAVCGVGLYYYLNTRKK